MAMDMKVEGNRLTIVIDNLDAVGKRSKSGNSNLVASTGGFVPVPGSDLKLGLNLIRPT